MENTFKALLSTHMILKKKKTTDYALNVAFYKWSKKNKGKGPKYSELDAFRKFVRRVHGQDLIFLDPQKLYGGMEKELTKIQFNRKVTSYFYGTSLFQTMKKWYDAEKTPKTEPIP